MGEQDHSPKEGELRAHDYTQTLRRNDEIFLGNQIVNVDFPVGSGK